MAFSFCHVARRLRDGYDHTDITPERPKRGRDADHRRTSSTIIDADKFMSRPTSPYMANRGLRNT